MKNKLNSLSIVLALLAGVASSAEAQVTNLGIAPAGGQSILYWPTNAASYGLQTTPNLASPDWVTASNAVPVNAVVVTNSAPAGYFRLLTQANPTAGMALIPASSFRIGNVLIYDSVTNDTYLDLGNALPTNVYVSAFYMDVNLVSYSQWQEIYAWATNHGYGFAHAGAGKAADHPVQTVDWFDCVKWSNARSEQAGLRPVYYTDAAYTQVFTNGDSGTAVYVNWTNNGYRLPTEAEWEIAAQGGASGNRFPWGNGISDGQANYKGDTNGYGYDLGPDGYNATFTNGGFPYTSPVGSFPANRYGLYDMAGNVYAWCWDWYATPYGQPTTNNPTGPDDPWYSRILRGGAWSSVAVSASCAYRYRAGATTASFAFGFRCVKGL